ncbi:TolC family protein [Myxococcota bacterium]|nr:TolC family protein [Myxococcota bacterium]
MKRLLISTVALLVPLVCLAGEPSITLDQALRRASTENPQVRIGEWATVAARARKWQAMSYYGPTLSVEGNALWWDEPIEFALVSAEDAAALDCTTMPAPFDAMCEGFAEPTVVREQHTTSITVSAVQPITGLLGVSQGHMATARLQQAAEMDERATRAEVAVQVVDAYFGALAAEQMVAVATAVVENLEAHERRAVAFHEAELLNKSDLLQIQVALGNARINRQRAIDGRALARGLLAVLIDAEEPSVIPEDISEDALLAPARNSTESAGQRPDVAAMELRVEAARAGRRAAAADLVPQVAAIAAWQRTEGMGTFSAPESMYAGVTLQWQVWGWGRKHAALRESTASLRQAEVGLASMRDGVDLEQRRTWDAVVSSWDSYEMSRVTVAQAEENHRLVAARFESQLASATDLLDAESLLAQARMTRLTARYDYLRAVAAWQRAAGVDVAPLPGTGDSP